MNVFRVSGVWATAAVAMFVLRPDLLTAQGPGSVTGVRVNGDSLVVSAGTDEVLFVPCTEDILLVDFRPNGATDVPTLVVGNTAWTPVGASIDTNGDPLVLSAGSFHVEINRNPLRYTIYSKKGTMVCSDPEGGGLFPDSLALSTSGGTFYGLHNRFSGNLSVGNGGVVSAGSQGGAGGPFVWTTDGWGLLVDETIGDISIAGNALAYSRAGDPSKRDLAFYVILGPPKQIMTGLHEISGFAPLFPKYTFGFLNTEWGIDQPELYNDIRTYRAKHIPLDAYILDFDWMDWGADNYGEFRWGPKFPDGQSGAIVDTLSQYGMHLMGIRKPRIHLNTVEGQYCVTNGFFVDTVTDYFSHQTVGRLNFLLPAVRSWYWQSFAVTCNSYAKGITGYWNDEADEYGGNLMFMEMERAQYEGQRSFNTNRVWSINRNFFTGAQRYAYGLWSGDIQTGFPSMADQRLFMLSSITLGAGWWGMDIGGFHGTPTNENYFRWIQFGAFTPIFRVHGSFNLEREPWYFGAEAESLATDAIRLRYRLMPYIYEGAWENHLTGIPFVRPLVIDYPDDPAVTELSSEWMFGNSLLVSPVVTSAATAQSVYLPQGTWYAFASGAEYPGSASYSIPVTDGSIPLFVKAGALIPMSPVGQYVGDPASS